jgi:hypothetical protein
MVVKTRPTFRSDQHKITFFFQEPSVPPQDHIVDGHFSVLLAKFEQGDDPNVGIGARFKNFLRSPSGADMDKDSATIFWAVRNSVVHAFNTPDADNLAKLGMKSIALAQRRTQQMRIGLGYSFVVRDHETATVYIDGVYQVLLDSINTYRDSLYDTREYPDALPRFTEMFETYGTIEMRTAAS